MGNDLTHPQFSGVQPDEQAGCLPNLEVCSYQWKVLSESTNLFSKETAQFHLKLESLFHGHARSFLQRSPGPGCKQVGGGVWRWPLPLATIPGAAAIEVTHVPAFNGMKIHMPGNLWQIVLGEQTCSSCTRHPHLQAKRGAYCCRVRLRSQTIFNSIQEGYNLGPVKNVQLQGGRATNKRFFQPCAASIRSKSRTIARNYRYLDP